MLPWDFFTFIDIDELPRSAISGSRVDDIYDLVGTLTARSLSQVDASASGGRDSHISRDTVRREADISVVPDFR
jgi:hypothetical protein